MFECIIDCMCGQKETRFLSLMLQGKYVFQYSVDAAIESGMFDKISILTPSGYIAGICSSLYGDKVDVLADETNVEYPSLILSGRAPFINSLTIRNFAQNAGEG